MNCAKCFEVKVGLVVIGKPERQVHKASQCAANNNRDHQTRSLYYCLFTPQV